MVYNTTMALSTTIEGMTDASVSWGVWSPELKHHGQLVTQRELVESDRDISIANKVCGMSFETSVHKLIWYKLIIRN